MMGEVIGKQSVVSLQIGEIMAADA